LRRDLAGGAIVSVATFPPEEGTLIPGVQGTGSQKQNSARSIPE
jgi:hypothetical protein